jgi:hypothetical protein
MRLCKASVKPTRAIESLTYTSGGKNAAISGERYAAKRACAQASAGCCVTSNDVPAACTGSTQTPARDLRPLIAGKDIATVVFVKPGMQHAMSVDWVAGVLRALNIGLAGTLC